MTTNNIPRDGALVSPWQKEMLSPTQGPPATNNETAFDCTIIGDGITNSDRNHELSGFFGYYGAADEFVCGAHFSIKEILSEL